MRSLDRLIGFSLAIERVRDSIGLMLGLDRELDWEWDGDCCIDRLYYDEYSMQELDDGEEVIAWLAAQSWSNGCVFMYGKSWGGFNGLQLGARRPAALKGIITLYFTGIPHQTHHN